MPLFRREPIGQDSLTGLLDREAFIERCDAFSERGSEVALAEISLVFLDVHNLKDFNAREGIDRGDDVLKVIAGELRKRFPKGFAARYSVDCFLVMATIGVVPEMVDAINHQLPSFGEAGGLLVKAGYVAYRRGFGAAVGIERARFACDSIRDAEGVYVRLFDASLGLAFARRAYVVEHLDEAIERGEIRVFAQPIVRLLTGKICEVECLARWESAQYGFLSPADFVPELERHNLIHRLDAEVIRLACAQWAEAQALGTAVPFGINLSRLDFELCDIYHVVRSCMAAYGVPVDQVHVEVTESALSESEDAVREGIRRFREAGFELYMDDFGTGYSSLSALANLNFDVIKLDMSLVRDVETSERARAVLADVVSMVKRLGMQTLCEGVENEEQLAFLRAVGCEKVQGYYYGKPADHAQTMERLGKNALQSEDFQDDAYFDAVGQVNLIDGTSAQLHGVEAAAFLGREPIAVVEFDQDSTRLLCRNFAYDRLLSRLGHDSFLSFVSASFEGTGDTRAKAVRACRLALETGTEQSFDFIMQGFFCKVAVRHVASTGTRDAFLNRVTLVEDSPYVTEGVLLSGLLDVADRYFFWKDAQRRFLGANQAFLDYYGFESLDCILGKTDEDMGWHVDNDPFRNDELSVLQGKSIHNRPGICRARGVLRDIVANKRPLYSNGRIVGLVGYFTDLGPHED